MWGWDPASHMWPLREVTGEPVNLRSQIFGFQPVQDNGSQLYVYVKLGGDPSQVVT